MFLKLFRKMLFFNCNYSNFVCLFVFYLLQPKQAAMRDEVEILKKLHHVIIIFSVLLFSLNPLNFNILICYVGTVSAPH